MHCMTTVSRMLCVVNTASTTPSEVVDLSPIIFATSSRGVDISGLRCGASCLTHWMMLSIRSLMSCEIPGHHTEH